MPGATAVLFQTHILSRRILRQFCKLRRRCPPGHHAIMLMHVPAGTPKPRILETLPHHFVTTPELRDLNYPAKREDGSAGWDVAAAGDTDLLLLHFWAARRGAFDHFWTVEYDVRYSGDWRTFFEAFATNEADLLATTLRRRDADPDWLGWATMRAPQRASACDGARRTAEGGIACFMPIFRASARGAAMVDRAYAQGWGGHCEAIWPTILNRHGMRIEDIGGDGEFVADANRKRFYSNTPKAWDLAPGTLTYRPVRVAAGLRRDTLWHPVKPLGAAAAATLARIATKLRSMTAA